MEQAEQAERILHHYRKNPVEWIEHWLSCKLWERQKEVAESVRDSPETSVASCHGPGKSFIAAGVALWFLYTHRPSIVITTAPTDRQVKGILWKEIRAGYNRSPYPLGGRLITQELKLAEDWFAWGFTAPDYDPDRFQGFHEVYILVVVDEASGVSDQIFEGIDGVLTSEHARLLLIGNPTNPNGRFANSFKGPNIKKIKISAYDTPNFTHYGITEDDILQNTWAEKLTSPIPFPYLVTPHWVAKQVHDHGWRPGTPLYIAKILGEFPAIGTDALIPMTWIDAAIDRTLIPASPSELGVDIARFGSDETCIYHRQGPVVRVVRTIPQSNLMETAGEVILAFRATGSSIAKLDTIGLGAGVYDRLAEQEYPVAEMNSSWRAFEPERFANARAEWFWALRERFESGDIDIEEDELLQSQLANLTYKINSRGQIQIEGKDEMKRRGLQSPDRADALMLTFGRLHLMPDEGIYIYEDPVSISPI